MAGYKCKNCGVVSSADDINNNTVERYGGNRAVRRKFVSIEKRKQNKVYCCPSCQKIIGQWRKEMIQ